MAAYGASVDGVRGHLPHLALTATSTPTQAQVAGHVDRLSDKVVARFGTSIAAETDLARRAALEGLARAVIELGAAAWAEGSAFPERTDRADASYATVLWGWRADVEAQLADTLGMGDGAGGTVGEPAYHFPAPSGIATAGF